jgi:hypothetical protein
VRGKRQVAGEFGFNITSHIFKGVKPNIAKSHTKNINMNLYFKINVANMKPHHQWQADKLIGEVHQGTLEKHTENPMHPTSIVVVQHATRGNRETNSQAKNTDFNERNEFLAFIKVLLHLLKNNQETARLHHAKKIIAECVLKNQNGNANFVVWKNSVDQRLRFVVGDGYWCQAQRYVDGYKHRRCLLSPSTVSK